MQSATSKMHALKSDSGAIGRRAVDAAVVLPLCAPAALEREASLPAQPDGVQAAARLIGEP
eukprot:2307132-Pleurochrysis_carterae.AAC.1